MAVSFRLKKRNVLPNWRNFNLTVKQAEYESCPNNIFGTNILKLSIEDYIEAWKANNSVYIASDMLSAAFVNGFCDDENVKEAAKYIIKNKNFVPTSSYKMAMIILKDKSDALEKEQMNNNGLTIGENINIFINNCKNSIRTYPYNPVKYVDLSRAYSIIGKEDKAKKYMQIALSLSPNNRFIMRSASRLFAHYDMVNYIHKIISNSDIVKTDPWVMATEIALSTLLNKTSALIKLGYYIINSNNYNAYNLSELSASIGTVELLNGKYNKAKKTIKKALISPNDNSLAQIEWINTNYHLLPAFDPDNYLIKYNYEAKTVHCYSNEKYKEALEYSIKWFEDLPFSVSPILFGQFIAYYYLNDRVKAIELLKMGLKAHPRDASIHNNIAYYLSINNQISEAENYLKNVDKYCEISQHNAICLKATRGLIAFRKNLIDVGKKNYEESIEEAKKDNDVELIWLARLNYARELILSKSESFEKIAKILDVPNNTTYRYINNLKKEVLGLYKRTYNY